MKSEKIALTKANERKLLKKYAETCKSYKRAKARSLLVFIVGAIGIVWSLIDVLFPWDENSLLFLLPGSIFLIILVLVAYGVAAVPFAQITNEYRDSCGIEFAFKENGFSYAFTDCQLTSHVFRAGITTVYSILYDDIQSVSFADSVLSIKGKGKITLYSDYRLKRKKSDCNVEEMDHNDIFRIFMGYKENGRIFEELQKHIVINSENIEKHYIGSYFLQRLFDFPHAIKHLPFVIIEIITVAVGAFCLFQIVLEVYKELFGPYYFNKPSGVYAIWILVFAVMFTIRKYVFKYYANHGYEDKHHLRIGRDYIELSYLDSRTDNKNSYVYRISRNEIEKMKVEGGELVITGKGKMQFYESFASRCLFGINEERMKKDTHFDNESYRMLLNYRDRKEIMQCIDALTNKSENNLQP